MKQGHNRSVETGLEGKPWCRRRLLWMQTYWFCSSQYFLTKTWRRLQYMWYKQF